MSLVLAVHGHYSQTPQPGYTHANPYGESVERACECIVTFARLRWGLVKVNHNCEACHEEEPEDNPELLDAFFAGISLP